MTSLAEQRSAAVDRQLVRCGALVGGSTGRVTHGERSSRAPHPRVRPAEQGSYVCSAPAKRRSRSLTRGAFEQVSGTAIRPQPQCTSRARVARYYDPATAQFLTRDPLEMLTRQAYDYAGGDPLDQSDPTGLFCWLGHNPDGSCRGASEVKAVVTNPIFQTVTVAGVCTFTAGAGCIAVNAAFFAASSTTRTRPMFSRIAITGQRLVPAPFSTLSLRRRSRKRCRRQAPWGIWIALLARYPFGCHLTVLENCPQA